METFKDHGLNQARAKVLRSKKIYHARVFDLFQMTLRLPNGTVATHGIVKHPGAVAIVPVFPNQDVLLIHQYRHATGGYIYEIPAGTLEKGETPKACARRELIEETRHRASSLRELSTFFTAPGFCSELMHLFLAEGLRKTRAGTRDSDEVIRVERVPLQEAVSMVQSGRIRDAKTMIGLMWVWDAVIGRTI